MSRISKCVAFLIGATLILPVVTRADPLPATPNRNRGSSLFHNNCIICHGGTGQGNGGGSPGLKTKPADLTDRAKMATLSDDQMVKVILHGGRSVGASKIMPAWKDVLEEDEVRDVVAFIRADLARP
jgi:cytochrome c oxidase cbb3-type subunit 3